MKDFLTSIITLKKYNVCLNNIGYVFCPARRIRHFFGMQLYKQYENTMDKEKSQPLRKTDKEAFRLLILFVCLMCIITTLAYFVDQGTIILKWQ